MRVTITELQHLRKASYAEDDEKTREEHTQEGVFIETTADSFTMAATNVIRCLQYSQT